jgi:hypothetical protein
LAAECNRAGAFDRTPEHVAEKVVADQVELGLLVLEQSICVICVGVRLPQEQLDYHNRQLPDVGGEADNGSGELLCWQLGQRHQVCMPLGEV